MFVHTVDDKGRLSIPVRFREVLKTYEDNRLILTFHDQCLWTFPFSEWVKVEERMSRFSLVDPEARNFLRHFLEGLAEVALDRQGRILIPLELKKMAQLDKEVIILGIRETFELWNRSAYEAVMHKNRENQELLAKRAAELGL
jgi:MraZ protein